MSLHITTITLGDLLHNARDDIMPTDEEFIMPNLLLPSLFLASMGQSPMCIQQVPTPVSTVEFPDIRSRETAKIRKRGRPADPRDCRDCPICLDSMFADFHTALTLPCGHAYHRTCLFAILTNPVLGARSMIHCSVCRRPVDRSDLSSMGLDVSPRRLILAQHRCDALRQLLLPSGGMHAPRSTATVVPLIRSCKRTCAVDGFLYNSCVLALDRALFHRRRLAESIHARSEDGIRLGCPLPHAAPCPAEPGLPPVRLRAD